MSSKYILPCLNTFLKNKNVFSNSFINNFNVQIRNSSYQTSKLVEDIEGFTSKFEVTKSPEDWKYVERLLAPAIVPTPVLKQEYVSGWTPQKENAANEKYFVPRNKNHMVPVYIKTSHRGMRKISQIKKIQGEIFELEKDLKSYLQQSVGYEVATQVNELVGYIHVKGDYVRLIKEFLTQKGF